MCVFAYIFCQRLTHYDYEYVSTDIKSANGSVQTLVTLKTPQKSKRSPEEEEDDDDEEVFNEQNYVDVLCSGSQGGDSHHHDRSHVQNKPDIY